jgi:hypothetical protein
MSSPGSGPSPFKLTKWYLDVVDGTGRSAIAFWSVLRWGPLALRWEGLSLHEPGREAIHRSGIGSATGPLRTGTPGTGGPAGEIAWISRGLSCDIRCHPWTAPFGVRLLETDHGVLDWTCEAPAATVWLALGSGSAADAGRLRLIGDGYAECLALTILPWKLPISELRWGRWSCAATRRSIVWLDWRGRHPLTLVLVDGAPADDARVEDDRIRIGSSELLLAGTRRLHTRTVNDILSPAVAGHAVPGGAQWTSQASLRELPRRRWGGLGPVARRLPASWRALEDRKSRSVGRYLRGPQSAVGAGLGACGTEAETGWAIHELVRFP